MKNAPCSVRFLSLWLTASLLLVSVWSQHLVAAPKAKANTEQTAKGSGKATDSHQTVVSALSPMATASPVVLHFAQDFVLLPPVTFALQRVKNLLPPAPRAPVLLSYFQVLFRHFIVVNAP
jgi:hypothetical protein